MHAPEAGWVDPGPSGDTALIDTPSFKVADYSARISGGVLGYFVPAP